MSKRIGVRRRHANRGRRLPRKLRPLFWELDTQALRWDADAGTILGRLLYEGGLEHVRIARSRFGDETIRNWIRHRRGRGLSPQRLRFWELILELPDGEADAWVRAARRSSWAGRTSR